MNRLLSWASSPTYGNKWDRLALTKNGTLVAGWVWLNENGLYDSRIFNNLPGGEPIICATFKTLDEARKFADQEFKKQGYIS